MFPEYPFGHLSPLSLTPLFTIPRAQSEPLFGLYETTPPSFSSFALVILFPLGALSNLVLPLGLMPRLPFPPPSLRPPVDSALLSTSHLKTPTQSHLDGVGFPGEVGISYDPIVRFLTQFALGRVQFSS